MPEKTFASDLVENDFIQTTFLVAEKELRTTRNGDPYLRIALADRTGKIEGRVWDEAESMAERFEADDFVTVRAQVTSYDGELQLKVGDIQRADESELELRDYFPYSRWSGDEMLEELQRLISENVRSDDVRGFLGELFSDETFVEKFKRAPAAKSNHHEYFGGLLEHCLSMARIAVSLGRHYAHYYPGFLNQDLVIAGCIIHDMGKVDELSYERSVNYSTEGKLVGHITQGVEMVTDVAGRMDPPPPDEMIQQLKHLVLSHHGHREYGSPVEPRTPEAMLLHQIDMIDSRMNLFYSHLAEHRDGPRADEPWTTYHRALESDVYAGPVEAPGWADPLDPDLDPAGPGLGTDAAPAGAKGDDSEDASDDDSKTMDMFDE